MTQRLTQERLDEIDRMELPKGRAVLAIADLRDEIDALRAELATERAETARLNASLLAYWAQYGCVSADTGRWQAKLDEAEQRGRAAELAAWLSKLNELWSKHGSDVSHGCAMQAALSELADAARSPGTPPPGAAKDGA